MAEGWQQGTKEEHRVSLPGTTHTNGIGPQYETKQISNLTPLAGLTILDWLYLYRII